jgi:hypothetical protein
VGVGAAKQLFEGFAESLIKNHVVVSCIDSEDCSNLLNGLSVAKLLHHYRQHIEDVLFGFCKSSERIYKIDDFEGFVDNLEGYAKMFRIEISGIETNGRFTKSVTYMEQEIYSTNEGRATIWVMANDLNDLEMSIEEE